jgi:hypothetical protein
LQHQGWEEPTTAQPPTWDDEPQVKAPTSAVDAWLSTTKAPEGTQIAEQEEPREPPAPETAPEQDPPSLPAQLQNQVQNSQPEPSVPAPSKPTVPSVQSRPVAVTNRSSARYKTTDQPVVMPISFGAGIEKVGMQFGSLSLGGDVLDSIPCAITCSYLP